MPEITLRRVGLTGAIFGAGVGGTVATVMHGTSGPAFWAGLALGAISGPACLAAIFALFEFAQSIQRRILHRM